MCSILGVGGVTFTDALVAHYKAGIAGLVATEDVEFGAAESGVGYLDYDIGWVDDCGNGAVFNSDVELPVEDHCFHGFRGHG